MVFTIRSTSDVLSVCDQSYWRFNEVSTFDGKKCIFVLFFIVLTETLVVTVKYLNFFLSKLKNLINKRKKKILV